MSSEEKEKPSPSQNGLKPEQSEKRDSTSITSTGDPTIDVNVSKPVADDLKPVSLFGLFKSVFITVPFHLPFFTPSSPRYSTRAEVTLNVLTLIAAVAAGASQVCFLGHFFFFCFICHIHHFPTDGCFR